ncbi:SDR family oxidoreductase [Paenibacillus whitsoniae]|uniref:SDR family oxidoreductase n=1 Tax=Paenibacillus whitsoniae TaxID=2496558 RepID=A0A3S0IF73_9BACL|nr:SDR family oxidoreductase [Paenibacillus whitsoniae]RTE11649.1 SDR family oxidoreductase [Paenibacillus whitsoniae]
MTKRTWLITGVSSGFGRLMTEQLLERGDRVAGTVRNMEVMDDLKNKYGDLLWLAQLDVTDTSAIRRVVNDAFQELGKIDVVVNNAGYGLFGAAEELTDEQIIHQIETNLIGSIQVVRAVLPNLRAQGNGRIIQLSTVGGQAAFPGGSLYHASKWGIEGFMESVMHEVAPFNIGVTIVEPGGASTNFRYKNSKLAPKIEAYEASPAIYARRMLEEGTATSIGDPAKMVTIMIDSVAQDPAPRRIALGSDSYTTIHKALTERLESLEAQKDLAFSTDFSHEK